MKKNLEWQIVGFLGVVSFVLGMWGYHIYFVEQETYRNFQDLIFHTVKLFGFDIVDEYASPLPLQLDIARYLSPAVLLYTAMKTILYLVGREIKYVRMRSYKNHIIVSSINRYSKYFIKDLLESKTKTVLLTEGEDIANFEEYEREGAVVVQGSVNDFKILDSVSAARAKHIVLLNEQDEHNISSALAAFDYLKNIHNQYETTIFAHISDYNKLNELKEISLFDKIIGDNDKQFNYDIRIFSVNERSSRVVFNNYAPDKYVPITSGNAPQPHIAVFGSNIFTQSLIVQFARMAHFVNFEKLKVTLFHQNEKFFKKLLQSFPYLEEVIELNEVYGDLDLFDAEKFHELHKEHNFSSAYLTCRDDALSLHIFNKLAKINFEKSLDAVITLIEPDGVLSRWYPEGEVNKLNLHKFNVVVETFKRDALLSEDIDKLAKIIHQDYLDNLRSTNTLNPQKASHRDWIFLSTDFKDQNRLQADHIWVKLRAAGLDPNSDFTFDDKPDLVEKLAKAEHRRWQAHMALNGWKYGKVRSDVDKVHPDMIPYEELSDDIKQYDRNAVLNIPKLLRLYRNSAYQV